MNSERKVIERTIRRALSGKGAHAEMEKLFEGMDWQVADTRPEGVPHSLYQLLNHLVYWQDWAVRWLDGESPPIPRHASGSWPGGANPATREDWQKAVQRFRDGLDELGQRSHQEDLFSTRGKKTRIEMILTIASHNSYHAGQVVFLRRMLGTWPPPSGGLSW
jgi:uncharacterized damage-inducible protein DinB